MNPDGQYRRSELDASALESFGGQTTSNATYQKARELRRWIAQNPGKTSADMPENLRSYLPFLLRKRLVRWEGATRRYYIKQIGE